MYVIYKKRRDHQRAFLLSTLCAVKSSDFARTNESIVFSMVVDLLFLVLDFKVLLTPYNAIGNPAKFLLVEFGIPGFGVRNTVQGIRTPTND